MFIPVIREKIRVSTVGNAVQSRLAGSFNGNPSIERIKNAHVNIACTNLNWMHGVYRVSFDAVYSAKRTTGVLETEHVRYCLEDEACVHLVDTASACWLECPNKVGYS